MKNYGEVVGAGIGTAITATGASVSFHETLQVVALVLTIIGSIITIAMAIIQWWKNAKKDGKITKEELQEGISIIQDGAQVIKDSIKDKEGK